jgi:hypothetical protein
VRLPFDRSLAEIGEDGWVSREIGMDHDGRVVYKFPLPDSPSRFRGICDMVTFGDAADDLPKEEFEALWAAPLDPIDQAQSIRAIRGPSSLERMRGLLTRHRTLS